MKKITTLFAICIACVACHKRNDGHTALNLVSHFPLSTGLYDINGYSYDVAITEPKASSSYNYILNGKVDSCIHLIDNAYVECNDNLFVKYVSEYHKIQNYSVSFWCKINDMTNTIVSLYTSSLKYQNDIGIDIKQDSLRMRYANLYKSGLFDPSVITKSFPFNKFNWNNIIVVCDNTNYYVYLNGNEILSYGRKITNSADYLEKLTFGNITSAGSVYMYLDELNVWNYAISPTEATNYYNSTK